MIILPRTYATVPFFAVKCTNCPSARQAVTTTKAVSYSLLLRFDYFGDYSSIAACAAARRAIGTRNGEQET